MKFANATVVTNSGANSGIPYQAQASLPQQLEAPVEKGQTVGTVQVYHGETLLGEYEVKAAADAPRMDFGTAFSLLWGSLTG